MDHGMSALCEKCYRPVGPPKSREQLADEALEAGARDGMALAAVSGGLPHPRDYGGTIFESRNGPRWQIENQASRQLYLKNLADYWRLQAEKHPDVPERTCQCATYCMVAVGAKFDPPVQCRGLPGERPALTRRD